MIIMQLMGGLGNQMFQYALGRRLALERGVPLKLNLDWFEKFDDRCFELDQFNIKVQTASTDELLQIKFYSRNWFTRKAFKVYQFILPYYRKRYVIEKYQGEFDINILNVARSAILLGYWQSEQYFKPIEATIRQDFSLRQKIPKEVQQITDSIHSNPNSVSIHIRRGDYTTKYNQYFAACSVDYYKRAASHISAKINNLHFYIFSDDIKWAKNNLALNADTTFIEPDTRIGAFMDMYLMSQCRHHINANSSFSWWGAWLGEKSDSIVIAPKRWFVDQPYPKDTIPERWVKL